MVHPYTIQQASASYLPSLLEGPAYIVLSNNMITGTIPTVFASLYDVAWFDLENNHITSRVPLEFCDAGGYVDVDPEVCNCGESCPLSPFPTPSPTKTPTSVPTSPVPTKVPTVMPVTPAPTIAPTVMPSTAPTKAPTVMPTPVPTKAPTVVPSAISSTVPSDAPSNKPSVTVSITPSTTPSNVPAVSPSFTPSTTPHEEPSETPSIKPSATPSSTPSLYAAQTPTTSSSSTPSTLPSRRRTTPPSIIRSISPTKGISNKPSLDGEASNKIIALSTTGVSVTEVTTSSFTALGALILDFFESLTDLIITEVIVNIANMNISDGARYLQDLDDGAIFLFEIRTISLSSSVYTVLIDFFTNNLEDFTNRMRNSDPAFLGLIALQVNNAPSSYPSVESSFPSHKLTGTPSQEPSLTPPVTSTFVVPYKRMTNATTNNLTAVEAILKEDDISLLEYLSTIDALADDPFSTDAVFTQVINGDEADSCFDSENLCYTVNTNVNVTRYPITYSTIQTELIILSSVLDFMEDRDIAIVPLVSVPYDVESVLSTTFGGVASFEIDEPEVEAFEATTFDFLFDNLGPSSPPVLVENVTFLSQSLSLSSSGDGSSSVDSEEGQGDAEMIVSFGVSGEYLPPPEIDFDDILVKGFDEEGQQDYLEILLSSDNDYFNSAPDLEILDVRTVQEISKETSNESLFGALGDEGGYTIIAV